MPHASRPPDTLNALTFITHQHCFSVNRRCTLPLRFLQCLLTLSSYHMGDEVAPHPDPSPSSRLPFPVSPTLIL